MSRLPIPGANGVRPMAPKIVAFPFQRERPETHGSGHRHWTIQAYAREGDDGTLEGVTTVVVEAQSEMEAVSRAMEFLERPYYRVSHVEEVCEHALRERR